MSKLSRNLRYDWPLHFVLLLMNWLPDNVIILKFRGLLASHFLGDCGHNLELGRNITFYNPSNIRIGNDVYLAFGCWIMAGAVITIEDEVMFGPYCIVVSSNHRRMSGSFRYGNSEQEPITVKKGAWIAGNVVITAGSIVGVGSLIAASSVVTSAIPEGVIAGGQPARVIKEISDDIN